MAERKNCKGKRTKVKLSEPKQNCIQKLYGKVFDKSKILAPHYLLQPQDYEIKKLRTIIYYAANICRL